jgi:benzoate 4-monooxygenase
LVEELDSRLPSLDSPDEIAKFDQVKDFPYLNAVISEVLRYRPTSALGLPRLVRAGGATICGEFFKEGTVLSVPSCTTLSNQHDLTVADTIHRNEEAFFDANTFLPDRWLNGKRSQSEKYFIPFSYGPRACVGRNVAMMELLKVLANLLKRYHFELIDPTKETILREGFLVKPTELWVRMTKREQHSN